MSHATTWKPERHSPQENERRATALLTLDRQAERAQEALRVAERLGVQDVEEAQDVRRHLEALDHERRFGPARIEERAESLRRAADRLRSDLRVELTRARGAIERAREEPGTLDFDEDAQPEPRPGTPMRAPPSPAVERARIRARILEHYWTSGKSSKTVADEWAQCFREARVLGPSVVLSGLEPEYFEAYENLTGANIRYWNRKVRKAREEARQAERPEPSIVEALTHRMPKKQVEKRTKRTGALLTRVHHYIQHVNARATYTELSAALGGEVSPRTMRRLGREDYHPAAETQARTGQEGLKELFWLRLSRYPERADDTWLIDDSGLALEAVERGLWDPADYDIDLEMEACWRTFRRGRWVTERVQGLWVQLIVDAFSSKRLLARLFPRRPSARDTLLTIARAARRFGLPRRIYTDNGANFTAEEVVRRLDEAGVARSTAIPYEPRGRGKVERPFLDLKEQLLHRLPGFQAYDVPTEELPTVSEIEPYVQAFFEGQNERHVRVLGRTRNEAYLEGGGGAATANPRQVLALLRVHRDVTRAADGIHFRGRRYYCPGLARFPRGTPLDVYDDPDDQDSVWILARRPDGTEEWAGSAWCYDALDPAPELPEQRREEVAVIEEAADEGWRKHGEAKEALERERERLEGAEWAEDRLEELEAAEEEGAPPSSGPALPPPPSEDDDEAGGEEEEEALPVPWRR